MIKKRVKSLENRLRCKVELVKYDPMPCASGTDEDAFLEDELPGGGVTDVLPYVLL